MDPSSIDPRLFAEAWPSQQPQPEQPQQEQQQQPQRSYADAGTQTEEGRWYPAPFYPDVPAFGYDPYPGLDAPSGFRPKHVLLPNGYTTERELYGDRPSWLSDSFPQEPLYHDMPEDFDAYPEGLLEHQTPYRFWYDSNIPATEWNNMDTDVPSNEPLYKNAGTSTMNPSTMLPGEPLRFGPNGEFTMPSAEQLFGHLPLRPRGTQDQITVRGSSPNRKEKGKGKARLRTQSSRTYTRAGRRRRATTASKSNIASSSSAPQSASEKNKLDKPLSQLISELPAQFELLDLDTFVHRGAEERGRTNTTVTNAQARSQPGDTGNESTPRRPLNAFMLYRKVYYAVAQQLARQEGKKSQQDISRMVGASWRIESTSVRRKFWNAGQVEAAVHDQLFPPVKNAAKPRKFHPLAGGEEYRGGGDEEEEEDKDDDLNLASLSLMSPSPSSSLHEGEKGIGSAEGASSSSR